MSLSVVVPCFNEFENIFRFPDELIKPVLAIHPDARFIFVDDGSKDETFSALTKLAQQFKSIDVVRHERNKGLGASLKTGFKAATGDLIVTLDADLTFHPREIPTLLNALTPDIECVMGSPFLGQLDGVSFFRGFLSKSVNFIYRLLLGFPVTSTSSMFRVYRAKSLKALTLVNDSFDINAEVLFGLVRNGGRVKEVPVTLGVRQFGESKINVVREIKNHLIMFVRILFGR